MNHLSTSALFLILLFTSIHGYYNPIPIGCIIITTISKIIFLQPKEYGESDQKTTIYTATQNLTIVSSIYEPTARNLFVIYTNQSDDGTLYLSQIVAREQLASFAYRLPIKFNSSNNDRFVSMTSDVSNHRGFITDKNGTVTMFSLSGLLQTKLMYPANIIEVVRSVAYNNKINRLFMLTDTLVYSCSDLELNNLQCCEVPQKLTKIRSIAFDPASSDSYAYVTDDRTGVYRMTLDASGCPISTGPVSSTIGFTYNQLVVDGTNLFYAGSVAGSTDNSYLIIANGVNQPRSISADAPIVSIHISYPQRTSMAPAQETCFNGITYTDYRIAVVLAAIFGTIMGIFMCFNALFCIDFFMTKRIIRNLKKQIPHNLLEDRWNKLVEEKYAKIALEKARKQNDPPADRRVSSLTGRKISSVANPTTAPVNPSPATTTAVTTAPMPSTNANMTLEVPHSIPKLSAYLRRKSENYFNRRRSDDPRAQRQEMTTERPDTGDRSYRAQFNIPTTHIEPVEEENENQRRLRPNLSHRALLQHDEDFL